jgi:(heptosyl)LPS beta-1,4-glucosyltransferase
MPKVTVLITCKNEELHIRDCIESARLVADEVLVADSGSTDATLPIVAEMGGCRVVEREFISYADFKNWALPQCKHEWVLILDADERVTPELAAEVKALLAGEPKQDAYWVRRDNYFLGYQIRYCGWGTSKVVRLVRRDACRYFPRPVHEAMNVPSGKTAILRSRMSHYTAWDIEQFVAKQNNYAARGAIHLHAAGKRVNLAITLLHAPFRFFQLYILRGGFLDGYAGLMVCGIMSFYAFLKDINVWGIDHVKDPPEGLKRKSLAVITVHKQAA